MTDLAQMLTESEDALGAARETITMLRGIIHEAWGEITDNPDIKRGDDCEMQQGVRTACDAAYAQGAEGLTDAADALRDYLVSRGLSAAPVGTTGDAGLDRLVELLL
jgi:hypothetical protein